MKRTVLTTACTILLIMAAAQQVYACGDISDRMCVLIPEKVAKVLTNSDVLKLAREKGHIRHLGQDGSKVEIAVSENEEIVTKIRFGNMGKIKVKSYSWPIEGDWLVRIEDYPNLVRFLLTEPFAKRAGELTSSGAGLTSLRISLSDQPTVEFGRKSLIGNFDANGNFISLEEK